MSKKSAIKLLISALAVASLSATIVWQIFGMPGDGWSRADERAQMRRCTDDKGTDLTENTCACFQDFFQDNGVSYDQLRSVGAPVEGMQALIKCGSEREHDPFADPSAT